MGCFRGSGRNGRDLGVLIMSEKGRESMSQKERRFTFLELSKATQNFRAGNLLGRGGFGSVYKGRLQSGQSRPFLKDLSRFVQLADPLLQGRFQVHSLKYAVAVTGMCLQEEAQFRPSIQDVVEALECCATSTDILEKGLALVAYTVISCNFIQHVEPKLASEEQRMKAVSGDGIGPYSEPSMLLAAPQPSQVDWFCKEGDQRLLVYEYMKMGTLEDLLFGNLPLSCNCVDNSLIVSLLQP
ncbi:hypothetical protein RJ639_028553 [Escallonia herrerae]|uniref:Uncharacterized protein n=1 Tax=Escallonia herrerae TaxID=1293975 RepID=A0AA88X3B1_9ASTE|nr:hypothetical protein RJ639_028553 [Escallonia herrerae]